MKIAMCLQHVPFEGPGVFRQALESRGYVVKSKEVPTEGLPEDPEDFLLIMGGPMSVNDPEPWIAAELQFLQQALHKDIPILGICFGSQLLAKSLGGTVSQGPCAEIGMAPVYLTNKGRLDPVFAQVPSSFKVFQWHGEGINLPQEILPLMESADFSVQAYSAKERCYGLLFHLEMEEAGIQALCRECPDDVQKSGISPEAIQSQALREMPFLHQLADRLIGHLVH